jgi:hypothetical protein
MSSHSLPPRAFFFRFPPWGVEPAEPTLDDLLADPVLLRLMDRDGVQADQIRALARHAQGPKAGLVQ